MMPKYLLLVVVLGILAACNTVKGAGRDVSAAGSAITDEAAQTQKGM